jgi:UDP-N-acetylmuramate dehydrogenase
MQGNLDVLFSYLSEGKAKERLTYKRDYPMASATTFRIGGNADIAVWPQSADEVASLTAVCRSVGLPFVVIGNGSNLLFDDDGYRGAVILTTAMNRITRNGNRLTAECGVPLTRLASYAAKEGLGGLSFAYGIPGTLGGGVFMNAGAYGGELMNVVTSVSWYDPVADEFGTYVGDQNAFGYRESIYQRENKLILSAELALTPADPDAIRAEMEDYLKRRKDKQPLEFPSAGSAFKRYPGYFTAQLIDEAGLKGYTVGGAQVSEKHAGFIINRGGATCDDVLRLIDEIKAIILKRNGIEIEPEIRYIPCPEKKG